MGKVITPIVDADGDFVCNCPFCCGKNYFNDPPDSEEWQGIFHCCVCKKIFSARVITIYEVQK